MMNQGCFLTFVGVCILSLVGCSNKDLPDYVKLGDLRVLALIASTPEVNTGASVTITPILSDLNGKGRALTYSASVCNDPGVGYGASPSCESSSSRVILATQATVSGLSSPNYTGSATSFTVSIPETVFNQRTDFEKATGVNYLVTYRVQATDGTSVSAFKRILVSTQTASKLNQNPQISTILKDGASFDSIPSGDVGLSPQFAAGTPEIYTQLNSDFTTSSQEETLSTTWFISDGSVEQFRTLGTASTKYSPPSIMPSGRNLVFVVVTRDGRGGEGYKILSF